MAAETLSLDVVARRSGFATGHVRRLADQDALPFPTVRLGDEVRVPVEPFERWLAGADMSELGEPQRAVEAGR